MDFASCLIRLTTRESQYEDWEDVLISWAYHGRIEEQRCCITRWAGRASQMMESDLFLQPLLAGDREMILYVSAISFVSLFPKWYRSSSTVPCASKPTRWVIHWISVVYSKASSATLVTAESKQTLASDLPYFWPRHLMFSTGNIIASETEEEIFKILGKLRVLCYLRLQIRQNWLVPFRCTMAGTAWACQISMTSCHQEDNISIPTTKGLAENALFCILRIFLNE